MEGQDIKGLMEAYSHIYSEPEVLNEEVEVEEVDMELEEDSEGLDESSRNRFRKRDPEQIAANRRGFVNRLLYGNPEGRRPRTGGGQGNRRRNRRSSSTPTTAPAGAPGGPKFSSPADEARQRARAAGNDPDRPAARPAPTPAARPAAPKPAAAAAPKPAPKPQTGDKSKDMAAWAKANPKLAAAKAERDRTRGTSASTNPLMRGMPGKRPAPTSLNKTGAGAKFDPKAPKILNQDVDIFDIIKGHLLDEGFAETEESAMVIMANMSEEWRQDILEFLGGQKGDGMIGHPNLGIKNPLAKKQTGAKTSSSTGLASRMGNNAAKTNAAINAMRGK